MKSILELRSNKPKSREFLDVVDEASNKPIDTMDVCMKCFKYPPIVNNIYCISCMQCESCLTILSTTDEDCPHCSKKVVPTSNMNNQLHYHQKPLDLDSTQNPYVVDYNIANSGKSAGHDLMNIIRKTNVPRSILRYIMMNFLDLNTIINLINTVKEMNVLDNFCGDMLYKAKQGFAWNCKKGNLDVAKWLYSRGVDIHADNEHAFRTACKNGHLDVARWLHSLGDIDIHVDDEYAFRKSCVNGHLHVARWLHSIGNIYVHTMNNYTFKWSCRNNHLVVAQWLYSLGDVDIHEKNDYLFRWFCKDGNLKVAQWLYSLGRVDIHAENEWAFRRSCQNGYLIVAQWLHSLGNVNIHAENNFVFNHSHDNNIKRWLQDINKN